MPLSFAPIGRTSGLPNKPGMTQPLKKLSRAVENQPLLGPATPIPLCQLVLKSKCLRNNVSVSPIPVQCPVASKCIGVRIANAKNDFRRSRYQLHSALADRYILPRRASYDLQLTIGQDEGYDVVCFLADVGQEEDWAAVEAKALKIGAKKMIIDDLRKEFVTELCYPAIRKNSVLLWCQCRLNNPRHRVQCDLRGPISAGDQLGPSGYR